MDFDEANKHYIFHVQPKLPYPLVPEKLNPDLRISDQRSEKSVRGEQLLRQMELLNGVKPECIEVSDSAIVSMTGNGITLTLPQDGIKKLFLPAEFFTADRLSGKVELRLYPNWNYSFRTARGFESISGAKLAQYLSGTELQPIDVVQRRIAAMV